eukprot:5677017-Heterocapsa_arctica.AAC.1
MEQVTESLRAQANKDDSGMWRAARRIAGNRIGLRGIRYRSFPSAQPTPKDWRDDLAQNGMKGGQPTTQVWNGYCKDLPQLLNCRAQLHLNNPVDCSHDNYMRVAQASI